MSIRPRAFAILFALGAVLFTLLDSIHVHTHTLAYAHPFVFGSAWWVPLLMGCATSFGGVAYVLAWSRAGGPPRLASGVALGAALVLTAVMYAASGLMPVSSMTKLVVLTLGAAVIFFLVDGTRTGAVLMLAGAVCGPIAEAINPGFDHLAPDFMRVPMWLPALYACVTPAIGQLARKLAGSPRRSGQWYSS